LSIRRVPVTPEILKRLRNFEDVPAQTFARWLGVRHGAVISYILSGQIQTVEESFLDRLETVEEIRQYWSGKYPVFVYDV
jgi:hypothetical protein